MSGRKTVLITGGTSGIGAELVRSFVTGGWNAATCGRNSSAIGRLREAYGPQLLAVAADIRLENHVSAFLDEAAARFGGADAAILNAGTLGPAPLPRVLDTGMMELRKTFETNVFANFNLLTRVASFIRLPGVIVHMTSDAAVEPYPGWGAYGSSKAAMRQLVEVMRVESEGSGLSVFNYDPGDVDTPMHALAIPGADRNALRKPAEVAAELFSRVEAATGGRS